MTTAPIAGRPIAPPRPPSPGARILPRRSLASMMAQAIAAGDSVAVVGPKKAGKTSSFAFGAPRPFFIFTDRGGDAVLPASFADKVKPDAWDTLPTDREPPTSIMGALRGLLEEEHPYQTVVIDTIDRAQILLWTWICAKHGVTSIEEVGGGFGKGFIAALEQINEMLSILFQLAERRGMNWIIIGHQEAKSGNDPSGNEYERWQMSLNQKSAGAILGAVNTILFAEPQVETKAEKKGAQTIRRGQQTGVTRAIVRSKQGIEAGSRWLLPPDFLLSWAVYEQEKASGEALRERLYTYLPTLDLATRAEVDTYLGKHGWSRAAVEQVITGLGGTITDTTTTEQNSETQEN